MLFTGQLISQLFQDGVVQTFQQGAPGYVVGWGSLALINAGLAQGKNRSGLFFFLISLLLGPIATLIIVLLPKPRPPAG